MDKRIKTYSIGEVSRASGVSVRMLRHYDEIGLLPAFVRDNGYRAYGQEDLERLQEILGYRAMEFGLADIKVMLDGGSDRLARLRDQRDALAGKLAGLEHVLETLDDAIDHAKKGREMSIEELYKPFFPDKQAEYEAWLIETYGDAMVEAIATSKAAIEKIPKGMEGQMAKLKELEAGLVEAFLAGAKSADVLCEQHRAWVAAMWGKDCPPEAYTGLADMYQSHPDFVARYEALEPKFSQWLPDMMKAYAAR